MWDIGNTSWNWIFLNFQSKTPNSQLIALQNIDSWLKEGLSSISSESESGGPGMTDSLSTVSWDDINEDNEESRD